jgi:ADP-ribosyl-[dinitrogen reductase] hydrolase
MKRIPFFKHMLFVKKIKGINNGNGSLMRLAPVPITFHKDIDKGMKYAADQSYTTHDGLEAAECCRLLTFLTIKLINRPEKADFKEIFDNLGKEFKTSCIGVKAMAESRMETEDEFKKGKYPKEFNLDLKDRDWEWRKESRYQYSPKRLDSSNSK